MAHKIFIEVAWWITTIIALGFPMVVMYIFELYPWKIWEGFREIHRERATRRKRSAGNHTP